jgi:molecular chaperone DnaK (HSP70)
MINGFPLAKKGIPKIVVTIAVDTNGIINVSAVETKMNLGSNLVIEATKGRLT